MKLKIIFQIIFLITLFHNISFAQYEKVNSQGLDIHYRIFGEGTPILIIGGGPGDHSDRYVSLCEVLSPHFKCILVDQRGTGKSSPEIFDSTTISIDLTLKDFEAIRNNLEIEQWAVLGFSYGGYLATLYTHFFPLSVSELILLNSMGLNTNAFGHFLDNINSGLQATDVQVVEYWSDSLRLANDRQQAITEIIRARMPGYFYDREKSLLVTQTMKAYHFNFDMGRFIWTDIYNRQLDIESFELNYTNPVLIMHGRQDPLGESVPISINHYFPQSEMLFIEKCGHYSWIEQPEKVLSAVMDFLKK
ncbi:alpha/beta fold hydrolase [Bacteroidota bacterium]